MDVILSLFTDIWKGHFFLIAFLHTLAWFHCLTIKGWVSDDLEGIAKFSDRFVQTKDPQGVIKEEKIDYYEETVGDKKVQIKNIAWNLHLPILNRFMRWFRLNLGKRFTQIGKNSKDHPIYGWVQDARKHHALNFFVQLINLFLLYNFLKQIVPENIAFLATLIFSVHPCLVQTVAWISGVNYLFSLFGILLALNVSYWVADLHYSLPLIGIATLISGLTLLPGCLTFLIFLFLGKNPEALVSGLIGTLILLNLGREAVSYRVNAFKEQNMGKSTKVYLSKLILVPKTIWYYIKLVIFPKRLGLFHTWGYHFDEPIEQVDKEFWAGILVIGLSITGYFLGPLEFQLGIVWFYVFLFIFSNVITAQQFVSERYVFISLIGFSLILAKVLAAYPILIAFLLGIYIMRIWVHFPTFYNEVRFYESNVFNFPTSEGAMGNLGVAYLNHGMPHKAIDTWFEATRQNPIYDVPWYNLYSLSKQNGDVIAARNFLKKCLDAKTVHFNKLWEKELAELDVIIAQAISDGRIKVASSAKPNN